MSNIWNKVITSKHFKFGAPFILLLVGGSFGLREFSYLRYRFRKIETLDPKEFEKHGVNMKKQGEVTLESEYEKIKELDIDNWENVRGPRLWDETPVNYDSK